MSVGYLYCFSTAAMPGIVKIGMTTRTPDARLDEANRSDTWRPPTPYVIEFAKRVTNPRQKETTLHALLARYTERIHSGREFFRISPTEARPFFDLMDGALWSPGSMSGPIVVEDIADEIEHSVILDCITDAYVINPLNIAKSNWAVAADLFAHIQSKDPTWTEEDITAELSAIGLTPDTKRIGSSTVAVWRGVRRLGV